MTKKIKISEYVSQFLEQNQIKFVFEMSGGMIARLLDSINQKSKIKIIISIEFYLFNTSFNN